MTVPSSATEDIELLFTGLCLRPSVGLLQGELLSLSTINCLLRLGRDDNSLLFCFFFVLRYLALCACLNSCDLRNEAFASEGLPRFKACSSLVSVGFLTDLLGF